MENKYKIPNQTHIGHVHLKVADLNSSLDFYCGLLGFEITTQFGNDVAFISAGGYHHHIGLNTWHSKGLTPSKKESIGLFHIAIVYPTRKDLARIYDRISKSDYHFTGFANHGVSEALYLDDPDGNGVELYWDRPKEEWHYDKNGAIEMFTATLDLENLLEELI